jgi:adenylate cyclase
LRYLFEEYAFDTDRRELHRGADVVSVAPQVFDLLDYLIRNRERVVTKDELINTVWNGRNVSDAALTTRLNVARSAVGDSGEEQRLIKTLPRKGFRFVGQVREAREVAGPDPGDTHESAPAVPDKPSIAVLPFANMSDDPEQEYFANGMVEDIITALSRFKSLFVIARNSSFTYKGRAVDIKQIGRELGVRYVLEGSVGKAAGRVRISGQLIEASTGAHLWAEKFDGALGDVFELQDAVTERIVGAIEPSIKQAEINRARTKPTSNLDAYDYYLRAFQQALLYTREGSDASLNYIRKAIALDPGYALAKAYLSIIYMVRWIQGWGAPGEREKGLATAREAIVLDPDDPSVLRWAGHTLGYWGEP